MNRSGVDDAIVWLPNLRRIVRAPARLIERMSATRANYWIEFVVDVAAILVLGFEGWRHGAHGLLATASAIMFGLLVFSFLEYFFHRWLFHTGLPLFANGHRKHHENPLGYDSLPFFLPAMVSVGLAGLYMLVMPVGFALLVAATVTFGYVAYGLSHFAIHHVRFRQPLLRTWAAAHHIHHYHPDRNFGVTTPLWDILLRTRYVRHGEAGHVAAH